MWINSKRIMVAGLALFFIIVFSSFAESKYTRSAKSSHAQDRGSYGIRSVNPSKSTGIGPLGSLMGSLIVECGIQTAELSSLPIDTAVYLTHPDEAQTVAIENVRRSVEQAANTMAGDCPSEVPSRLLLRVAATQRALEVVEGATSALREPLESFYDLLRDEQKARLAGGFFVMEADASDAMAGLVRTRSHNGAGHGNRPTSNVLDCGLWLAELRNWPMAKIEQSLELTARQRGPFYELAASLQFAADNLEDACPAGTQRTPIERLSVMVERLEALHQSMEIISAPLRRVYEVLDEIQLARLATEI